MTKIKLFLDDQINDPNTPDRHPPNGWVGCSDVIEACRLIKSNRISHIDFDHDMGDAWIKRKGGYLVAKMIESLANQGKIDPIEWKIHSKNSTGARNIQFAMKNADKFWEDNALSPTSDPIWDSDLLWHPDH